MQQVQRLLRDQRQGYLNPGDLAVYINRARREVAARTQCVRILTPISAPVVSVSVTSGGSGYTSPTVTVSAPDFPSGAPPFPNGEQATALAIQTGGTITAIDIQYGGAGYFQPQITIDDPTGTGAEATAVIGPIHTLNEGQEKYNFSDVDLGQFPGVGEILAVHSISILYSNYRYSLPVYSFSTYQAFIRQYPYQYQWVPSYAAQYGQGTEGSLYVYPLPSQTYQWEWDCFCLPADLLTNGSPEVIPRMWRDGVPFYAAYLAYFELQNHNFARSMKAEFDEFMKRYGAYARPGRVTNPYGRY